jgi:hypothetical protein
MVAILGVELEMHKGQGVVGVKVFLRLPLLLHLFHLSGDVVVVAAVGGVATQHLLFPLVELAEPVLPLLIML